jgi:tetratricopeptide (TPR) repeat protein
LLKNNGKFLYNYGASLSHNGEHKLALKLLSEASDYFINTDLMCYLGNSHLALQEYKEAELSFMDAHHTIPHKIFPLYQLVQIYDTTHREHLAIEYAEKILATKVKVKSDLTMNIKREMRLFLRNKRLQ